MLYTHKLNVTKDIGISIVSFANVAFTDFISVVFNHYLNVM